MGTLRSTIKPVVNSWLRRLGLKLVSLQNFEDTATFIPFDETRKKAELSGMPIGDYVDTVINGVPDGSRNTIQKMVDWGVLSERTERIVEIGPGTGRYLEKSIGNRSPSAYEIYETAGPWADYLVKTYGVMLRNTDGYSLGETRDASVDLVQAHKVFNTIPVMATMCYWREAVRVLRPGGWIVFDLVTEECLAPAVIDQWVASGIRNGTFPSVFPLKSATDYFSAKGFALKGSHVFEMRPGASQLLAFRKSELAGG